MPVPGVTREKKPCRLFFFPSFFFFSFLTWQEWIFILHDIDICNLKTRSSVERNIRSRYVSQAPHRISTSTLYLTSLLTSASHCIASAGQCKPLILATMPQHATTWLEMTCLPWGRIIPETHARCARYIPQAFSVPRTYVLMGYDRCGVLMLHLPRK